TEKERWRIRFERPGVTGGTLATASNLLFHGSNDGTFSAYTADKGEKDWSVQLAPGFANPITYMIGGQQYVTVLTGRSGMTAATIAAEFDRAGLPNAPGRELIQQLCAGCHSPTVVMRFHQPEDAWRQTVNDMGNRGMPGNAAQREAIVKYLAAHLGPAR